jgi:SAM-dependent methyltransferase
MADAYGEDLAYIHDAGFGHFARGAAAVLLEDLKQRGVNRGLVIDLGCGSGILSERLSAAGYEVLGIDQSPAFIALADKRVPAGQFRVGSLLSADLPACVAVAAVGECFNYLFDANHSWEALTLVFRRIFDALCPGGLLLCDVAEPGRVPLPGISKNWIEGEDWVVLVATEEDKPQRLLTRDITSFRKVGELYRRTQEIHRLRLLPRAEVATQLRAIGFEVQALDRYALQSLAQGHAAFLARKPAQK